MQLWTTAGDSADAHKRTKLSGYAESPRWLPGGNRKPTANRSFPATLGSPGSLLTAPGLRTVATEETRLAQFPVPRISAGPG